MVRLDNTLFVRCEINIHIRHISGVSYEPCCLTYRPLSEYRIVLPTRVVVRDLAFVACYIKVSAA